MKVQKLFTVAATFIVGSGIALAAGTTPSNSSKTSLTKSNKTTTHHLMGTITSINASDLVVSHKYHGKEESSTFMLNSLTKKEGNLMKGDEATIYYQVSNNQNVATDVKVNPQAKKSAVS